MVERIAMVSIIIPVYNTKEYLPRCLDSIVQQTYEDWELILVDDESTDGSVQICESYARKDSRIQIVHQKNAGPAAARQNGLSYAKGEWITFADSDDWAAENLLEVLVEEQKKTQADMVCANFVNIDDTGKIIHPKAFEEEVIECHSAVEAMRQIHETRHLDGALYAKLYRRSLFDGVNFCSHVTIGEDYSLIVQLSEKAGYIRMIQTEVYYRFTRRGSISHAGYTDRHRDAFDNYMNKRVELIRKYPELEKAITGFHTEFEMAVITAMCRNQNFDRVTIGKLKADLRKHMKWTWQNPEIALYMKICAWMIAYPTRLFTFLFRILYLCTGR